VDSKKKFRASAPAQCNQKRNLGASAPAQSNQKRILELLRRRSVIKKEI
jgi:hypothetical protein